MKKFSNLDEQITTKYESKDSLRNDIYTLINDTIALKITNENKVDSDIDIFGKEELVEKIKNLIDETRIKERVLTLEHVKANVHRNFDMNWLNEQIDSLNESLENDIQHIIEYPSYKNNGDKLYAGQNSNFQQNLTNDGKIINGSELKIPYIIGSGDNLYCYNYYNLNNPAFLNIFNKIHNTQYKNVYFH